MELRPADGCLSASVSSYVVRYVNRMERGGALVLADANEATLFAVTLNKQGD